ncbi:MAG: hypothetical protein JEY79_02255 [Pseudodesulfovibrio sp.]|nr:hypothetical protein [Pseudodesulfovibrio sp.]
MTDTTLWIAMLSLAAIVYLLKAFQNNKPIKVYRITPKSLQTSKRIMLEVLPLVEDGQTNPLDDACLPYSKDNIKSAAKILAYYFWKENQHKELVRIKHCFISLSRFQDAALTLESREKRTSKERTRLTREFNCYITRTPPANSKTA